MQAEGMEQNEKVRLMYGAVCDLIDEGADLHALKVSDITARAGIGKGTAYEYFRSKEELIRKALIYECARQYRELETAVRNTKSFEDAVCLGLTWIETNIYGKRIGVELFKEAGMLQERMTACLEERKDTGKKLLDQIFGHMEKKARAEKLVGEDIPSEMVRFTLLSNFSGYFVKLSLEDLDRQRLDVIKKYIYNMIRKSLR